MTIFFRCEEPVPLSQRQPKGLYINEARVAGIPMARHRMEPIQPVPKLPWGIIVMRPMIELMMPTTCKNGHIPFSQHGATPSADPVHVSPCFGAPSCLVCLDEVALSQDEVGKSRIGAAPGEGDEGPKAQRVDMTKEDIYSMTQFTRYKAATTMRVRVSASLFILFCFLG